jgi:hypothetical protein
MVLESIKPKNATWNSFADHAEFKKFLDTRTRFAKAFNIPEV